MLQTKQPRFFEEKGQLKRILFILDEYYGITPWLIYGKKPQGSPALYLLLEKIMQENITIDILYPSDKRPLKSIGSNLHIYIIRKTRTTRKFIVLFERVLQFLEIIIKGFSVCVRDRPQVIYSTGYMTPAGCLLGKIFRTKTVARVYGTFLYEKLLNKNIKNIISAIPEILVFKCPADIFIITNDGTRGDEVAEILKVPKDRIKFWVNGVDKKLLQNYAERKQEIRHELSIDSDRIIISSIGRLAKWKRVDLGIKVYANMLEKIVNVYAELLIVGDGKEASILKKLVDSLGIKNKVSFIGGVDHNTALKYIAASDILLFFYEHSNVGNVLLESLCAGKAVLCRDTGDTANFVEHGVNGLLVPNGSEEQIVSVGREYLAEMVVNFQKRSRLSHNAFAVSEKEIPCWEDRIFKEMTVIKTLLC